MEMQKNINSSSNFEKGQKIGWIILFRRLENHNEPDCVVLAKGETRKSMEYSTESRSRSTYMWSIDFHPK